MSDDRWLGSEPDEPVPGSGYGRTGDYGQSGQYQQRQQPQQQYPQQQYAPDPYASDPYAQDHTAQQQASYYSQSGQRPPAQDWNGATADYPQSGSYPQAQPYGQAPAPGRGPAQGQPPVPPPGPGQPQQGRAPYGRRPQAPQGAQGPQGAQPPADPYATGYSPTQRDPYASGAYPAGERDPRRDTGGYPGAGTGPGAPRGRGGAPGQPQDPYAGRATGTYERPYGEQDPYATGTASAASASRSESGNYERTPPPPGAPGGPGGPNAGRGGRRRAAPPPPPEFDEDEFAPRSRRSGSDRAEDGEDAFDDERVEPRRRSGTAADSRSEPPVRPRRRSASPRDGEEDDDERFDLVGDEDEDGGRDDDGRRSRGPGKAKRRLPCLAIFGVFVLIAGVIGYGADFAYNYYESHYGAPPDFASTVGTGTQADVTIPTGSGGTTIGGLLFSAGIVDSERAFTAACDDNSQCANIEAGTYLLPLGISAATAVTDLLNPKFQDSKTQLITYSGERAAQVFAALESKTGWTDAAVQAAVASGQIDLPSWDTAKAGAKFPYAHIEGFIASESYTLTSYKTPAALLKKMVDDQLAVFTETGLATKAQTLGYSEYQVLIIASMARAEAGSNSTDLNKISEVIYNRLKDPALFAHLGFDTTTLYGMGNSTTTPDNADSANPYNTSVEGIKGLPPGPIDNPDQTAVAAALAPVSDSTLQFFCATPDGIQYADTTKQWQELGTKYPGLCGSS